MGRVWSWEPGRQAHQPSRLGPFRDKADIDRIKTEMTGNIPQSDEALFTEDAIQLGQPREKCIHVPDKIRFVAERLCDWQSLLYAVDHEFAPPGFAVSKYLKGRRKSGRDIFREQRGRTRSVQSLQARERSQRAYSCKGILEISSLFAEWDALSARPAASICGTIIRIALRTITHRAQELAHSLKTGFPSTHSARPATKHRSATSRLTVSTKERR